MDRRIIRELRRDARQSNVALARTVGLTEGAVRRRIDLLVAAGTLRFTVDADQEFLGRPYHALVRIRCAPDQIDDVIGDLAATDDLDHIFHCTGQFDLTAVGHFRSTAEFRSFTTQRLGAIPGVVEVQSELVLRSVPVMTAQRPRAVGEFEEHDA